MFMAATITGMTAGNAGATSSTTYPPIERAAPSASTPCTSPSSSPPLSSAEVPAIEKRIEAFVGHHLTSIGQCANSVIEVALSPGSEDLAKKVRAHFGPTIQIDIGLTVWDGHPGRSPTCGELPKPSSAVAGYSIALDLGSQNIISGADLKGNVALKDTSNAPVRPLTTNPIEVVITKPGTRRVVGLYVGFIAGTGYVPLLMPGQTRAIPIVGGTARCDGGIGSALPPGHYDAVAEVSGVGVDGPGGGVDGQPPPTYFTPFVPIKVVLKTKWLGLAVGAVLIAILVVAGTAAISQADAVISTTPISVPATHRQGSVCLVSQSSPIPVGKTPPTVSRHPASVIIVWLPGLNSKRCEPVITRGGSSIASDLARDIDSAPVTRTRGVINCPSDDGTTARLYFRFDHEQPMEEIDATLSGCRGISAAGDSSRESTPEFAVDLRTLAPPAWQVYLAPAP